MASIQSGFIKTMARLVFCLGLAHLFACQVDSQKGNEVSNIPAENKNEESVSTIAEGSGRENADHSVATEARETSPEAKKYFEEGNEYSKQGQFSKSIKSYRKAIKINNKLSAAHYNLANVYVATGDTDEAVQEYQIAIEINPLVPDYHRNLGFAYAIQQNGEMAKKKYDELKKLAPVQAEELRQWIQRANQGEGQSNPPIASQ
ncbi:MAG: tetratricopeptide repeat protein [Nitrospinales bacterium]